MICVASECLRGCVGISPPRLISIAEPHYGKKTGGRLVKLAQMAGIADAEDWLCSKQDQPQYETLIMEHDIEEGAVHVNATVVFQEA